MIKVLEKPMEIQQLFSPDLIDIKLPVSNKNDIFRLVANKLRNLGIIGNSEEVYEKLLSREKLMTTGIGKGFAIPHAFASEVNKTVIYFASLEDEVEFASLDNKPVRYVFVIIGPKNKEGQHLKILARVSRLINNKEFCFSLGKIVQANELIPVIKYYEEQLKIS
jgi:fructose-specific phosphotransferase system IIA component